MSIKYGLFLFNKQHNLCRFLKFHNNPIGFSKYAVQFHQKYLEEYCLEQKKEMSEEENLIFNLSKDLTNEEYSIHLNNINNSQKIIKYKIYKMLPIEHEFTDKVIDNKKNEDSKRYISENDYKVGLGAAIGSIVGMGIIFGIYSIVLN